MMTEALVCEHCKKQTPHFRTSLNLPACQICELLNRVAIFGRNNALPKTGDIATDNALAESELLKVQRERDALQNACTDAIAAAQEVVKHEFGLIVIVMDAHGGTMSMAQDVTPDLLPPLLVRAAQSMNAERLTKMVIDQAKAVQKKP